MVDSSYETPFLFEIWKFVHASAPLERDTAMATTTKCKTFEPRERDERDNFNFLPNVNYYPSKLETLCSNFDIQ